MPMEVLYFIKLAALLIASRNAGAARIPCSCEEGQYCSDDHCQLCPPGTYRPEPVHDKTGCLPWSTRPDDSHYIVTKNGSATRDVEWECEHGFEEKEFSTGMYECVKIIPAPVTTSKAITTPKPITSTRQEIATSPPTPMPGKDKDNLTSGEITGIVIPIVLVLVLVIAAFLYVFRERIPFICKFCRKSGGCDERTDNGMPHFESAPMIQNQGSGVTENGTASHDERTDNGMPHFESAPMIQNQGSGVTENGTASHEAEKVTSQANGNQPQEPVTQPGRLTYKFFRSLITDLGQNTAYNFINILDDLGGAFNAKSTIEFKIEKHKDPVTAYTEACLEWVDKTPSLDHEKCISDALEHLGKAHLIDNQNADSARDSSPKRYKLFTKLVELIEEGDSKRVLYLLPNKNGFSADNSLSSARMKHYSGEEIFVEAFVSWKEQHPGIRKLKDVIVPLLIEINRNDAAQDENLLKLISDYDET